MRGRRTWAVAAAAVLLVAACRKKEQIDVDTSQAADIPREIAVQKLRELLPTAEDVLCTNPRESYDQDDVKTWTIGDDALAIVPVREKDATLTLAYGDIIEARLTKVGRSAFHARVFSPAQTDPGKEHLAFVWKAEEPARRVAIPHGRARKNGGFGGAVPWRADCETRTRNR